MNTSPSSEKLSRLTKIMRLRVTRAHREYAEKLEEWKKCKQEVDDMQEKFDSLQRELESVAAYKIKNKNNPDPQIRINASNRRRWLIYDQDLVKYDLDVAIEDLDEATELLNQCKSEWIRAQHREEKIAEKKMQSVVQENLNVESIQEEEQEGRYATRGILL